jgi:hypothetical protein
LLHPDRLVGRRFKAIRSAPKLVGNRMIGIRLPYDITHHLGLAGADSLTFIGNQIDCFHPIIIEAFKASFPIFSLPAIGQLDAKNHATAWIHGHQYRSGFRKDLITGKY